MNETKVAIQQAMCHITQKTQQGTTGSVAMRHKTNYGRGKKVKLKWTKTRGRTIDVTEIFIDLLIFIKKCEHFRPCVVSIFNPSRGKNNVLNIIA